MNWKIKTFTYLNPDYLLKLFFTNRELFKKIADIIIKEYYNIHNKDIIFKNIFLEYINLYPRITHFKTNQLHRHNDVINIISHNEDKNINRYIFNGLSTTFKDNKSYSIINNEYIYSNYILPHPDNSSIPFSIGITKNNKFKILTSNIFYFEIFLDTYNFRKQFDNESLKIGFTDVYDQITNLEFSNKSTFGVDCFNGIFYDIFEDIDLPFLICKGDTIGIGLEYVDKFKYKPFMTHNGKYVKLNFKEEYIQIESKLKVIINLKMATGIDVNFGNNDFKFDIESINYCSNLIHSTKNNLVNNGFSLENYDTDIILKNKKKLFNTESIFNLIS